MDIRDKYPYNFFQQIEDKSSKDKTLTDDFNITNNKIMLYVQANPHLYTDKGGWLSEKYCKEHPNEKYNFNVIEDPILRKYYQKYYFKAGNLLHKVKNPIILRVYDNVTKKYKLGHSIKFEKNINRHSILFTDGQLISTFLGNENFRYITNYHNWLKLINNTFKIFNPIYIKYGEPKLTQLEDFKNNIIQSITTKYNRCINGHNDIKEIVELKIIKYLIHLLKIDLQNFNNYTETNKYYQPCNTLFLNKMIEKNPEVKDILLDVYQSNSKYNTRKTANEDNKILDLEYDDKFIITPTLNIEEWLNKTSDLNWFSTFFKTEINEINDLIIESNNKIKIKYNSELENIILSLDNMMF
jgi:hypothetical protein